MAADRRYVPPDLTKLALDLPEALPIAAHAEEIRQAWQSHQVIIVGGDTGSGKTTQLPKLALQLGFAAHGRLGCTQPRRLAATAMARRVAFELKTELADAVGYQIRFDERTSNRTAVKFMTDGILLAETRSDRLLKEYETIIIDEAHERSLNIDFLLGYLKNLLPRRPDLKIAISSATLDLERFSKFFQDAPVIRIEGRTFPVTDLFMPGSGEEGDDEEDLSSRIALAVNEVSRLDPRGDILVFLPGEREIRDALDLLNGRQLPRTEVIPLFGRLSAAEQEKAFSPGAFRRIILATNVAETSITLPRIKFVIDSGLARVKRFNPRREIEELHVEAISKASARQRRGRCGRISEGTCVHLYSEEDLESFADYTDPEIRRTGLAGVILQMAALHLPRIDHFPFIDPPPAAAVREGLRTLEELCAIDPAGGITKTGWQLAAMPADPRIGKMLLEGAKRKILPEMLAVTGFLSIQDPLERPLDRRQQADQAHARFRHPDSDFLSILNLWNEGMKAKKESNRIFRRFCQQNFLHYNRMREWFNLSEDLLENARNLHLTDRPALPQQCTDTNVSLFHEAILTGVPRHVARYLAEEKLYLGTGGRKYLIHPSSALAKRRPAPAWLLSFMLVDTTRLFARGNAGITPDLIERAVPHLLTHVYDSAHWDEHSGFVYARERSFFCGLQLNGGRRLLYERSNPEEAREIFIKEALATGVLDLPGTWVAEHHQHLENLHLRETKLRRPDTMLDPAAVADFYLRTLPESVTSTKSLKELCRRDKHNYAIPEKEAMQEQFTAWDDRDYPDWLTFCDHDFWLRYTYDPGEEDDGVTLIVPTEELNLLPVWALDYPPPGWLAAKVEPMIRALPKTVRQALSPLRETIEEFVEAVRKKEIFTERPLAETLAEFVGERCEYIVQPEDFDEAVIPPYLKMKIEEIDRDGRVTATHTEVPAPRETGSRLSRSVHGAAAYQGSGYTAFPGVKPLPESVLLAADTPAYPALFDEGDTVGMAPYLVEAEARYHHTCGLLKLHRLKFRQQWEFMTRSVRFDRDVLLLLFPQYKDFAADLTRAAIWDGFGDDPWSIRDAGAFERAAQQAAETAGENLDAKREAVLKLAKIVEPVHELLMRVSRQHGGGSFLDLKHHYDFLLRPGFLRSAAAFDGYPRYWKGLKLRLERFSSSPGRDADKLAALEDYFDLFFAAVADAEITEYPTLEEYWLLVEECRLALFAPEVPLARRNPVKQIPDAWDKLRF